LAYIPTLVPPQTQVLTIALFFHQLLEAIALNFFIVRAQMGRLAGEILFANSYEWRMMVRTAWFP
jgi:hypothetical protein